MKKLAKLGAALVLSAFSFAADWAAIDRSTAALSGAVIGVLGGEFSTRSISTYLPGYGIQLSYYSGYDMPPPQEAVNSISGLVLALAGTVQGLDDGDYVSVSISGRPGIGHDTYHLLVRMLPGQADTLEVWFNGGPL